MSGEIQYTRLLKRQVLKHFKDEKNVPEELLPFIDLVNEAYKHYDSDREMLERSMEISVKELREKNKELKESNEVLDDFNHSVSHDLKTHAVNTISLVKMLNKYFERNDTQKIRSIIKRLENTGNQFKKVIDGFLKVSKFEKQLGDKRSVIHLDDYFEEIEKEFESLVIDKGLELNFEKKGIKNFAFIKEHLNSIIRNLITNAVKYSRPDSKPFVTLSFSRININDCLIKVSDNGIGIDLKKNARKLFKMFSRIENGPVEEGNGLGLFLVKKLIDKNNGKIMVNSELGIGTSFEIEFKGIIRE